MAAAPACGKSGCAPELLLGEVEQRAGRILGGESDRLLDPRRQLRVHELEAPPRFEGVEPVCFARHDLR